MLAFEAKPPPLLSGSDGSIRVTGTRVSLETVVMAFDTGATAEEIVQQYPSLDLGDVYAVISYVLGNRNVVDEYIQRRRGTSDGLQQEIQRHMPSDGIRARLLARRSPKSTG
jgi:uncharacterized protein (DUF433 family)